MPIVVGAIIAIIVGIALLATFWYIVLPAGLVVVAAIFTPRVLRRIRANRYFKSDEFIAHKDRLTNLVSEHNEIVRYVEEIRTRRPFSLGASKTGSDAHLATFENTSQYAYKRDRNVATYEEANVHNCSLQVVRNAQAEPLKYVMKYFNIKPTESTVTEVEELGESIARLESAISNLKGREHQIVGSIAPPPFILKHFEAEFMSHVGISLPDVEVPYPEYRFEYVSAGGNSSQRTRVWMDTPTIDALIERLSERVRFRASAAGQRALMTMKLRSFIKERDSYTCRSCALSISHEPNLLLEVDHIVPVSLGGLSEETNLQTLCWRCNRTKSNKLLPA